MKSVIGILVAALLCTIIFVSAAFAAGTTWTGAVSNDWGNAANWNSGVPTSGDDAIIPAGLTRYPTISSGTYAVHQMKIAAGATVYQTGGILEETQEWQNLGSFIATGGTVHFTSGAMSGAATNFSGTNQFFNVIIDNGGDPGFDKAACTISIAGNFTNNNTSLSESSNATFVFNGTGDQTITSASSKSTFGNLVVDKPSGTAVLTSNVTISGNATFLSGTLDLGTNSLTGSSSKDTLRVSNGATLDVGGSFPSNFTTVSLGTTSTVDYDGANQTILGGITYGNLTLCGSGTKTASGDITVAGDLTICDGVTLDMAGHKLTVNGRIHYGGTLTGGSSSGVCTFYSKAGGVWNSTSNWSTVSHTGLAASRVPGAVNNDVVVIGNGNAITLDANRSNLGSIIIESTGTLTTGTYALSGGATFTLESGGTLAIGSTDGISASGATGNIQTTTRSYSSGANYTYNGSSAQVTGNGLPAAVNNLTVSSSSGVTLSGSVEVDGVLTLGAVKLTTGSNALVIGSGGTVSRTSGYVAGNLRKVFPTGAQSFTFTIGDASNNYTPVVVQFGNITTGGNLTASATQGDHPNLSTSGINPARSVNRYYTLTNNGIAFTSYGATFNFVSGDVDGGSTTGFTVKKYDAGSWSAPTTGTVTGTSIQATGVTSFSDFAFGVAGTTWTGAVSSDWGDPANWTNGVPTSGDDATIPAGLSRYPIISSGTFAVHDLIIEAGATVTQTGGTLQVTGEWENSGSFISTGGTVEFTSTAFSGSGTNFSGTNQFFNLLVDSGANPGFDKAPGDTIRVAGNFTNNNAGLSESTNATFIFDGAGTQTIFSASSSGDATFGNLVVDKPSGTVDLTSNVQVSGNVTVLSGTLDLGANSLSCTVGGETLTVSNGATLDVGGSFPSNFTTISLGATSTVEYDGSNQTIMGGITYGNLIISGSGTSTASGNITVEGDLTISLGSTLDMAGYTLTVNGNTINYNLPPVVKAKVFLSGPYSGGSMSTALNTLSLIPLTQPYSGAPWSYAGSESVAALPAGVVDWVLVELRTGNPTAPPMTTVARRAAFVKGDGSVVDLDGTSPVSFADVAFGNYYIVMRHRNHLAIMSANAVALSASSSLYDFTGSQGQAFGTNAMKALDGTNFGMYATDVNANGGIGGDDLSIIRGSVGSLTYVASDVDMNGGVGGTDVSLIRANIGQLAQVP